MIVNTSGTLGDSYIVMLKLLALNYENVDIKHFTRIYFWNREITDIFKLLPNFNSIEFLDERPNICLDSNDRMVPTKWFPKLNIKSSEAANLLSKGKCDVIQVNSGKPRYYNNGNSNCKLMDIDHIASYASKTDNNVVLIGTDPMFYDFYHKSCINLVDQLSLTDAIKIVSECRRFIGPEGLMSFVALSHKIKSRIFYTDYKAIEVRIIGTPWEEYTILK